MIDLKNKYDIDIGGIKPAWVEDEWYSDNRFLNFLQEYFKSSSVEKIILEHKGRITRIIEKSRYDQVLCFDGWDNCADSEYLMYLEDRKSD